LLKSARLSSWSEAATDTMLALVKAAGSNGVPVSVFAP